MGGDFDFLDPTTWEPFDEYERIREGCASSVRLLSLSNRVDCYTLLDPQDYEWARRWLWCHTYGSGSFDSQGIIARPDGIYARRSVRVRTSAGTKSINLWLHKAILLRACGEPDEQYNIGDHINGDTLDNRRCNLRWATRAMNARNRRGTSEREALVLQQLAMAA